VVARFNSLRINQCDDRIGGSDRRTAVWLRRHITQLREMTNKERLDFAAILLAVAATYDQVFDTPFPYSMGLHPAPCDGKQHPEWQFHAHFYPPLLRSAMIRKYMVGFELLGRPQRDITPESAAETLRRAKARISASKSISS
jgi:UDPglucose--hexose-1-phosphate uridylyltransferase